MQFPSDWRKAMFIRYIHLRLGSPFVKATHQRQDVASALGRAEAFSNAARHKVPSCLWVLGLKSSSAKFLKRFCGAVFLGGNSRDVLSFLNNDIEMLIKLFVSRYS